MLRFDCFENEPHYHLAFAYEDRRFIRIDSDSPFASALAKLRGNVNDLLEASGAELMNDGEPTRLSVALTELREG